MIDLYREQILDHYRNPRNFGKLKNPDYQASLDNPLCGDRIQLYLKVKGDKVVDVRFEGTGCAISKASASMLTERLKDKRLKELNKMTKEDILGMLSVDISPARMKCALLPLAALRKAMSGEETSGSEK